MIPPLRDAIENFAWRALKVQQALYFGLVPALIYEAHLDSGRKGQGDHLPSAKRKDAIKGCVDQGLVNDESVRRLLATFASGDVDNLMKPLEQLMNVVENDTVQWIPYHMMEVLSKFHKCCSFPLLQIVKLFDNFYSAKFQSGDGWETLFAAVLMIRLLSGEFGEGILPLPGDFASCAVSYNEHLKGGVIFDDISSLEELEKLMVPPLNLPHVVVYYPSHAAFAHYDLVLAVLSRR